MVCLSELFSLSFFFFFFKQKTAYEMRISDWSSDVCSSDLITVGGETSRYKESATTPVVGLVIRTSERVFLYANRIEGLVQGPVEPVGTINAGDIFPPYKTKQYEIGGKVALGRCDASVALFLNDRPQTITTINEDQKTALPAHCKP